MKITGFLAGLSLIISGHANVDQLDADFTASQTEVCSGSSVVFTDNSAGTNENTEYEWDFGANATPATATGPGPHTVVYEGTGSSTVSLSLSKGLEDTETKEDYIQIIPVPPGPTADIIQPTCENPAGSIEVTSPAGSNIEYSLDAVNWQQSPVFDNLNADINYTLYVRYNDPVSSCYSTLDFYIENPFPSPPVAEIFSQTDCNSATGSISLTGLPSDGSWTITNLSNNEEISGAGTSLTISDLLPGTYSFTVTDSEGCTSDPSGTVVIDPQPPTPPAPVAGLVTQPDCESNTGTITFTNLPSGQWTLTLYPGENSITGSGSTGEYPGLSAGTYTFTVTNSFGCTSESSENIVIDEAPPVPAAPDPESIIQPDCEIENGSVTLSGLPSSGVWNLTRSPDNVSLSGSGSSITISDLNPGTYNFTVTNEVGCTSEPSVDVQITEQPAIPDIPVTGEVNQPDCDLNTGSVVVSNLPEENWTLILSPEGREINGSGTSTTITDLSAGTYSFSVVNSSGCTSESSGPITINSPPAQLSPPVPGTVIQPGCQNNSGSVTLNGLPSGTSWTLARNPGNILTNGTGTSATIENLPAGTYTFSVTTADECTSEESAEVVINPPPSPPSPPVAGDITHPSCDISTGSIELTNLPEGAWVLLQMPANIQINGSGTDRTISGLEAGTYQYSVTNEEGCTSALSDEMIINEQPDSPPVPEVSINCSTDENAAVVEVISPTGSTYEYSLDGGAFVSDNSFSGIENGNHRVRVQNESGCISEGPLFTVSCGCNNAPLLSLEGTMGSTCGRTSFTLSNNTFGGSATEVNISHNGTGTIDQSTLQSSPFSFTYIPGTGDAGNVIRILLETDNPEGSPCTEASQEFLLTVHPIPEAPVIEDIQQPSCSEPLGSVRLENLPDEGLWTLIQYPDEETITGTGSSTLIDELRSGNYYFQVEDANSCLSDSSASAVITAPPDRPEAPVTRSATQPDCENAFGSVIVSSLPPSGNWILTQYPGGLTREGSGEEIILEELSAGSYYFTITQDDCISETSSEITIEQAPEVPATPVITEVIQPSCTVPKGSITVGNLPAGQSWTLMAYPDTFKITGNENEISLFDLDAGNYRFIVSNDEGCTSESSEEAVITASPLTPELVVQDPSPVCEPETVDLTDPQVTEGSASNLVFSWWEDSQATEILESPEAATTGTYYIQAVNEDGCFAIEEVKVNIQPSPQADAGPDQQLESVYETEMNANSPREGETGTWSVVAGSGSFNDAHDPGTTISTLSAGDNLFVWTIFSEFCGSDADSVSIEVIGEITAPSLITPNADGINDFLEFPGIDNMGKTELVIFNRLGAEVFRDSDYSNDWNGVDKDGNDLPGDTYFYILTTEEGFSKRSFIVIRR